MATKKKTIAILEDDHHLREVLAGFFAAKGFDVLAAKDGFDIVGGVAARKPDLIITDLGLPGVSGDQVLKTLQLQGLVAGAPIIVVSAMGDAELLAAVKRLRAVAALAKPFDMDKLLELVERHTAAAPVP